MSLNANALITHAEFIKWLGHDNAQIDRDELCINAASQAIEKYTDRKWITAAAADEILSGNGQVFLYTKNIPIGAIDSISYRSGTGGTEWTSITNDWEYANEAPSGRIYFTDGNRFTAGDYNWKIVYIWGYAVAAVPADLKEVCAEWAAGEKKLFEDGLHGVSSKSFGDQNITFTFDRLTPRSKGILDRYKRISI